MASLVAGAWCPPRELDALRHVARAHVQRRLAHSGAEVDERRVVKPAARELRALRRDDHGFDAARVEDLLQALRREATLAEPKFLHFVAVSVRTAAEVFDGHVLIGRAEQVVLRHVFADHGDHGSDAHPFRRADEVHQAREVRVGVVVEFARGAHYALTRLLRHTRSVAQDARDGHGRDARFFGDRMEADRGRRRGHVFS